MSLGRYLAILCLSAQLFACRMLQREEFSLPLALLQEKTRIELTLMHFDASPAEPNQAFDSVALGQLVDAIRPSMPDLLSLQGLPRAALSELMQRIPAYRFEEFTAESDEGPLVASLLLFRHDRFEAELGRNLDVFLAPRATVQRLIESASGKSIFVAHGFWQDESPEERRQEWDDMITHLAARRSPSDALLVTGHWPEGTAAAQEQGLTEAFETLHSGRFTSNRVKGEGPRQSFVYCERQHCKVLGADIVKAGVAQGGLAAYRFRSWPLMSRLRLEASERDKSWRIARRSLPTDKHKRSYR